MTSPARQRPASEASLRRLRIRLTAWYAGTSAAILLLLGAGMFATITRRYDHELDESIRDSARELIRVVQYRGDATAARHLFDSSEFRIPDHMQFVTDARGNRIAGPDLPPWVAELARRAAAGGPAHGAHELKATNHDEVRLIRAYAEPFRLQRGDTLVAVVAADEIEIEDRYASLIVTFAVAAIAAVVLVAIGGFLLARKSTEPVERSIQHMRRFMADAAHELRTPLTILRSRAEVTLQRPREPDAYVSAIGAIEREATRLGGIVEDLLMLARVDAGERPIDRKRLFLDDIVIDAADTARVMADRRSVRLEFDELPETAIEGDEALLRQLIIILLDNAIKYTLPGGSVRLSITTEATTATLSVTDTGVGIAAAHLPHVFDRFYRADPARARDEATADSSSEGVGLGLSIARWIADQHGARLSLASEPLIGTTAAVAFPLATT